MSNTQGIKTISYLEYIYKSSVYFCNPKEYNILTYDAYQSHYFFKNLFLKIENIAAIWTWKSDILQQLANCRLTKAATFLSFPWLENWAEMIKINPGCMNFIFFSFWMLYEAYNFVYKLTLLGSEQRKQLMLYSYSCKEFCLLPSSKYNWVNSDCPCIGVNAYMWKKLKMNGRKIAFNFQNHLLSLLHEARFVQWTSSLKQNRLFQLCC